MHKKRPKICTGYRVSATKIYLYQSTKIAKARPHSVEWPTDNSVQKQWSVNYVMDFLGIFVIIFFFELHIQIIFNIKSKHK